MDCSSPAATDDGMGEAGAISGQQSTGRDLATSITAANALQPQQPLSSNVGNDIGSIVTKSKKAAASIWTLLHAKSCRLGPYRCPHPGCAQAKLTYLHLKTCPAQGTSDACSTNQKGCGDARKLLAHYRRCRDIRARQAGQQTRLQKEHLCLVCTFVARHARGMLERSSVTGSNSRKSNSKHVVGSHLHGSDKKVALNLATHDLTSGLVKSGSVRPRRVVGTFRVGGDDGQAFDQPPLSLPNPTPPNTPLTMPPPPPRYPSATESLGIPKVSPSELPHEETKAEDSAMALCMLGGTPSTSHDNQVGAMALCMLGTKNADTSDATDSPTRYTRPRAESLDVRSTLKFKPFASNDRKMLLGQIVGDLERHDEEEEVVEVEQREIPMTHRRRRSVSLGVISTTSNISGQFETIVEESVDDSPIEGLEAFD